MSVSDNGVPPIIREVFSRIVNHINGESNKLRTIRGRIIIQSIYPDTYNTNSYMCVLGSTNSEDFVIFGNIRGGVGSANSRCVDRDINDLGGLRKYILYHNASMDYICIDFDESIKALTNKDVEREYGDILADL